MAYPYATDASQAATENECVALERIGQYANDLDAIAGYIQSFLDRCRGSEPGAAAGGPVPVPSGYLGELDRLGNALHRVDCLARELQRIG